MVTGLINDDKVAALIGEIVTDRSLVARAPGAGQRHPDGHPGATNETVTAEGDCIFRVCYALTFQAEVILKLARSLDVEKAAILFVRLNPLRKWAHGSLERWFPQARRHNESPRSPIGPETQTSTPSST